MSAGPIDSVAAVGDVADVNTWSGIPFHFWQAARAAGWTVEPWRMDLGRFAWPRRWWNLQRCAMGAGTGGYQYSRAFLDRAEACIPRHLFSGRVLTFNQHFPRTRSVLKAGGTLWHYLDAPFAAFLEGRGLAIDLPRRIREEALAQERENLALSAGVICMARWAADAVVELCGVPRSKVHIVLPGANLEVPPGYCRANQPGRPGKDRPLVLGFVGKDWRRKGLPFLLEVADELARLGTDAVVEAIGFDPAKGPRHPRLRVRGFVNKARDPAAFVAFLAGCDLGCLFSEREALGISTLEFLRVSVPVIGFAHEGMADTLLPGASVPFPLGVGPQVVAEAIHATVRDENAWHALTAGAQAVREHVTWARCVRELGKLCRGGT